ncbi:hypothetical protein QQ020_16610 [Fulvivirgaceae bacterium BMA12]|uniref:Uncharacterized protein n=1 Tax=Agaribacillus aureus TaxID=3051825 RepID=A0ABT8LBE5_9BACT|nr:hypothetical protein [Fulvivirgaceae bacterium BMA12]
MKNLFFLLCLFIGYSTYAQTNALGPAPENDSKTSSTEIQPSNTGEAFCTNGMQTTAVSLVAANNWTDDAIRCPDYVISYYYFVLDPIFSGGQVTITQLPGTGDLRLVGSDPNNLSFFSGTLYVETIGGPFNQGFTAEISVVYDQF